MDVCKDCPMRLFNIKHHNLQGIGNPYFGICIVIPNVDYDAYKKVILDIVIKLKLLSLSFLLRGSLLMYLFFLLLDVMKL